MKGRTSKKDLPFESQVSDMGAERYDERNVEGKVQKVSLTRCRRPRQIITNESINIEPEAPTPMPDSFTGKFDIKEN